jgi:CRP-like cAMP-binding protein
LRRSDGATEELIDALRRSPLLSGVDDATILSMVEEGGLQKFEPYQEIVHEGDVARDLYIIIEGQVEVRRKERQLARLGRGQFFGETTILEDEKRSADVVALKHTRCVVLGRKQFRQLVTSNPEVALKLLEESGRRYSHDLPEFSAPAEKVFPADGGARETFEFKSQRTKRLFEYLVDSFVEDYMRKRYAYENSGWRGLADAARELKVAASSLYGKHGETGHTVGELLRRGLAEMRTFRGERGRGGEVTRVRVAYERDPVREYVRTRIRSQ